MCMVYLFKLSLCSKEQKNYSDCLFKVCFEPGTVLGPLRLNKKCITCCLLFICYGIIFGHISLFIINFRELMKLTHKAQLLHRVNWTL